MDSVSLGDIAGMIAALAFAFLVFRLGSVIGKAGKILDETRVSLRSTTDNVRRCSGLIMTSRYRPVRCHGAVPDQAKQSLG